MLDHYYFKILNHYKPRFKSKAQTVALLYMILLQLSIIMAIAGFIVLFFAQMNQTIISKSGLWQFLTVLSMVLIFRNWFYYTGKNSVSIRSKIKNVTLKGRDVWTLWLLPVALFTLFILIYTRL